MNGQQLKNSILQMAVQGKLVPQDPNDEPASVLIQRIREEKEKLIKQVILVSNKRKQLSIAICFVELLMRWKNILMESITWSL